MEVWDQTKPGEVVAAPLVAALTADPRDVLVAVRVVAALDGPEVVCSVPDSGSVDRWVIVCLPAQGSAVDLSVLVDAVSLLYEMSRFSLRRNADEVGRLLADAGRQWGLPGEIKPLSPGIWGDGATLILGDTSAMPDTWIVSGVDVGEEFEESQEMLVRPHPDFERHFKRPVYFAEGDQTPELSDEAWDLSNVWAVPLRDGPPMTLRGMLEAEHVESDEMDLVLSGELDEYEGDLLDLVMAAGYLILYCTGTLDDEGLDLLERAVAASASLDPNDPGLQAALDELRTYRQVTGR